MQEGGHLELSQKIYIGRCTEDMTDADLRNYFSQFGEVTDVFLPRPFRAFAFVTFADAEVAHSLTGDDHIIKGTSVHVGSATPKNSERFSDYGGPVRVGQWQSLGRGSQVGAAGGTWQSRAGGSINGGGPGRGRGMAMGGQNAVVAPAGEFQQQNAGNPFGTAAGFPPLNPAMVAAAQVALMGLMNQGGITGIQPAPGTDPIHAPSGITGTGPYGSPVSAGQPQGYTIGWSNAGGGQVPVSGSWQHQKSDMPGWSN